jgi:hypothetical protein
MMAGANRKPPVRQAAKASMKKTSLGAGSNFTKNELMKTMLTSAALTFAAVRPKEGRSSGGEGCGHGQYAFLVLSKASGVLAKM